jgi:hypothetical protein
MTAVRERHAEHRLARLQERHEDGHVRLGAGVRLHVGVLGVEELFEPLDREPFGHIDPLASTVVTLAGIAFGVLVGHHAALRFANGAARVVLRGDQLQVLSLAALLAGDGSEEFRVLCFDVAQRENVHLGFFATLFRYAAAGV